MNIPPVIVTPPPPAGPPKHHGCLMIWLLLMLIADGFTILMTVLAPALQGMVGSLQKSSATIGAHPALAVGTVAATATPGWISAVTILVALVDIVAIGGVFYWKRWGFYASVAASGVLVVVNVIHGANLLDPFMCLISPGLLYATLKMGGENCGWRRLQ